ncbi:acyltransferase domain-containing protein [Actinocrispum wychmicini]|uniref:[acyl-carrier-protein] S-malonyltransferase n=1 Tax=Actinocrispum wychmicini TaxID=1213861 RepID=A0A4R2IME7_9PSEU|nr:acyltransferase domain-containing protein [Actinocrispum wychmicini]TCO45907.1 phosphopantetheine binding protein [Actinocrispum wychmicini]
MKTVWMFPGPSGHVAGALGQLVDPESDQLSILKTIDTVADEYRWGPVSPLLLGPADETTEQHDGHLWLGFFATSLVLSELLIDAGVAGDVLIGHSGGEVSALVVAGCMTVEDAARVLCERTLAVEGNGLPESGMLAVAAPARRLAMMCDVVDDSSLAVSVDNSPDQVVVTGLVSGLERLETVAAALEIKTHRLRFAAAYHNPVLGGAARRLAARVGDVPVRSPQRRVYSPQLGRTLATADDARELLAGTLVLPVRFRETLRTLYDDGARVFVECGARQVLSELVPHNLPAAASAVPLLIGRAQAHAVPRLLKSLAAEHPASWQTASLLVVPAALDNPQLSLDDLKPNAPDPVAVPGPAEASDDLPAEPELRDQIRHAYADVLRFPVEMVEDDTELEGELGISSLQRTNVFVRLLDTYGLPTPAEEVQVFTYRTVADMAGLLRDLAARR